MKISPVKYPTIDSYNEHHDADWFKPYPEVDREYIWTYPLALGSIKGSDLLTDMLDSHSRNLTIYVHIPFCRISCPFCVFMHEVSREPNLEHYVDCLAKEVGWYSQHPQAQLSNLLAVYFGGGTASLLQPHQIKYLVDLFKEKFNCNKQLEVSLECHPDVVDEQYLLDIREAGVNRVSIGLQSFKQQSLQEIGRKQNAAHAASMVDVAVNSGFQTVSVDIMYRIPGQSENMLLDDFYRAVNLGVNSISAYSLETSNTLLENSKSSQPHDSVDKRMFSAIRNFLNSAGFNHIAQPDYALPGHENRYLKNFWCAPQELNLGVGAGGFSGNFAGYTFCNIHDIDCYIKAIENDFLPILIGQKINGEEAQARFFVLGARGLTIPISPFQVLFNVAADEHFENQFKTLQELDLAYIADGHLKLTEEGEYYVDTVSKLFYTSECKGKRVPWGLDLKNLEPQQLELVTNLWITKGKQYEY